MSPDAGEDRWVAAWSAALDEMDVDLAAARRMLTAAHAGEATAPPARRWSAPAALGPIPASLQERARALTSAQAEVTAQLAEQSLMTRRQAAAAKAMRTLGPRRPVYLDTIG